jgi:catalase
VGNNLPVFFIRDGIKFPDMVHALKPNPVNHIQEDWRIMDFFSNIPESMHMVSLKRCPPCNAVELAYAYFR